MTPQKLVVLLLVITCYLTCSVQAAPAASVTVFDDQGRETCPPLRRPGMDTIIVPVGYEVESDCGMCVCTRENGLVCNGCEDCSFHGETYRHQQTWWNNCNECMCDNSTIICREKSCPGTCEYHSMTKFIGEEWEDDCNTCVCTEHGTTCTDTQCWCDFGGVRRVHQERWEQNQGEWCTCLSGTIIGFACMFEEASELNNIINLLDMPDFG